MNLNINEPKTFGPVKINSRETIVAKVEFDDRCQNGHATFTITAEIRDSMIRRDDGIVASGCLHEEIAGHFPELEHLIHWHLCSTDGPLHYIANTTYWAKQGNLENARKSAIWPEATLEQLSNEEVLKERLPALLRRFREDIESIGFIWVEQP